MRSRKEWEKLRRRTEFNRLIRDESACRQKLFEELGLERRDHCFKCGANRRYRMQVGGHLCPDCKHLTTLKSRTIFKGSKLSLRDIFFGTYLFVVSDRKIRAVELASELSVQYETARLLKRRLTESCRQILGFEREVEQEVERALRGIVELRDGIAKLDPHARDALSKLVEACSDSWIASVRSKFRRETLREASPETQILCLLTNRSIARGYWTIRLYDVKDALRSAIEEVEQRDLVTGA